MMRIRAIIVFFLFLGYGGGPNMSCSAMEDDDRLNRLEKAVGYRFQDVEYLDRVFSHPGVCPENKTFFGRLEFLGDKVLGLVASCQLLKQNPHQGEGWLTQELSKLVSNDNNATIVDQLGLLSFCKINPSHNQNREGLAKIKADTCEALVGALYEDGGEGVAKEFVLRIWFPKEALKKQPPVTKPRAASPDSKNPRVELEEWRRLHGLQTPHYQVSKVGSTHRAQLFFGKISFTEVFEGKSKKEAKSLAANRAMEMINTNGFDGKAHGKSKADKESLLVTLAAGNSKVIKVEVPAKQVTKIVQSKPKKVDLSWFEADVSLKKAKSQLPLLCQACNLAMPSYSVLSRPTAEDRFIEVSVKGYKPVRVQRGQKLKKQAAQAMCQQITNQGVGQKKAEEALMQICEAKGLGAPEYLEDRGEFRVRVTVGESSEVAISHQSQRKAEMQAAQQMYKAIYKRVK